MRVFGAGVSTTTRPIACVVACAAAAGAAAAVRRFADARLL